MDTPADRLRRARIARGFETAADAARAFGWPKPTYTSHENGTRGLSRQAAARYARAFGMSTAGLLGLGAEVGVSHTADIEVIGEAAIGVWRDTRIDTEHNKNITSVGVPRNNGADVMRKAVKIVDESANLAFRPGEFAIFVEVDSFDQCDIGSIVVVERRNGALSELSIRRVERVRGDTKLVSHSSDTRFSETLDIKSVKLLGRVNGRYADL